MSASSASTIAPRFSAADVRPDRGMARRDAGHVTEAAGGEAQQRGVLLGAVLRDAHERGRGQVRHVRDDCDQRVVALGRDRDDFGPERRHDRGDLGVGVVVGVARRGEHPHGAFEQLGIGPLDAVLLRPGHGVPAHESRIAHCADDRSLHTARIGDDATAGIERGTRAVRHHGDRRRDERDRGIGVEADLVDRAESDRLRGDRRIAVGPEDSPAPLPKGHADRATDEPDADDVGR